MSEKKFNPYYLLGIAFIEGAVVMACELIGAKMIAPFFGTTIMSWAAVLAVTLLALAAGYYIGGVLTSKYNSIKLLRIILLVSSFIVMMMPFISTAIMKATVDASLFTGLLISLMIFLFPPIVLFGMVSPVIIHALISSVDVAGKTAGRVYAISTLGGVFNTLLLGFYIIPEFGLKMPAIFYGLIIGLTAIPLFLKNLKWISLLLMAFTFMIIFRSAEKPPQIPDQHAFNVRYSSEGLLGQVKVVDYNNRFSNGDILKLRGLLVNNTWQTVINRDNGIGMLDYLYYITPMLSAFDEGSNALLIGLGGGTLASLITERNINLDVVEIDPRLKKLSYQYFNLDRKTKVIVDDGRHFIETTDKKYDLIIFDAFLGENPPWQLLTIESFTKVKELLNPDGVLIIEFYGHLQGKGGVICKSVHHTLVEAGFETDVISTGHEEGVKRNFVYVSSEKSIDYSSLNYSQKKYTDKTIENLQDFVLPLDSLFMGEVFVLNDNQPILEKYLLQPALDWRYSLNELFRDMMIRENQPLFY